MAALIAMQMMYGENARRTNLWNQTIDMERQAKAEEEIREAVGMTEVPYNDSWFNWFCRRIGYELVPLGIAYDAVETENNDPPIIPVVQLTEAQQIAKFNIENRGAPITNWGQLKMINMVKSRIRGNYLGCIKDSNPMFGTTMKRDNLIKAFDDLCCFHMVEHDGLLRLQHPDDGEVSVDFLTGS